MKIIDWAAILGALAWLPHLIKYARDRFTYPQVRLIAQPYPEIGFSTYAPICNLRLAFAVKNRDLVVTRIRLRVRHENGEERSFQWQGIVHNMGQLTYPAISVPFEKESSVLAVKIHEKDIEERLIRFQETAFIRKKADYEERVLKKLSYLQKSDKVDHAEFLKSEEMTDLYSFIKQAFSWKPGKYYLTFDLESPERFEIVDNQYEFHLTPIDIQSLESNREYVERAFHGLFMPKAEGEKREDIPWNWRYPEMRVIAQ